MAPRKPKTTTDDDVASVTSTGTDALPTPAVLKPKNEKAKVTKPKAPKKEKVIVDGIEVEKPKTKAVKKEKLVTEDGEKVEKEKVKKSEGKSGDGKDGNGKEKVKAVTGEEATQVLLAYLKKENRPYSVTDVFLNLHGKVSKTVADKLLKEMEQNGVIMGKATKKDGGGQWVFWAIQVCPTTILYSWLRASKLT